MTASSVTGVGPGDAKQRNVASPKIVYTGLVPALEGGMGSPPSISGTVTLPYPLPGGYDSYVILLTTIGGGVNYVTTRTNDADGNFVSFNVHVEADCDVMFMIAERGVQTKS